MNFPDIKTKSKSLAPHNDRKHLSFVKDINVVGEKMARNHVKCAQQLGDSDFNYL